MHRLKNNNTHIILIVILGLFLLIFITVNIGNSIKRIIAAPYVDAPTIITGAQIPSDATLSRLSDSVINYDWIKYQYALGSGQSAAIWTSNAHNSGYQVLLSIAKNEGDNPIPALGNPSEHGKYCPYPEELDRLHWQEYEQVGTRDTGCYEDPVLGWRCTGTEPVYGWVDKYGTEGFGSNNGYTNFRDKMEAFILSLRNNRYYDNAIPDAIEIWNEPNLAVEWTAQGLGPVDPVKYANFLLCGIKGLRKGGYTGPILSAGLAPIPGLSGYDGTNWGDEDYFNKFYDATRAILGKFDASRHGSSYDPRYEICKDGGGEHKCWDQPYNSDQVHLLNDFNYIGWHSNVTENIPPETTYAQNQAGFQRVQIAINKNTGKNIWLTEFGWPRNGLMYNNGITLQIQRDYVARAVEVGLELGLKAMFVFNFGWSRDVPAGVQPELKLWDIEGEIPDETTPCENQTPPQTAMRDKEYVTDPNQRDNDIITQKETLSLIPKEVATSINDDAQQALEAERADNPLISIRSGFLANVIQSIVCNNAIFNLLGISKALGICTPDFNVGEYWQLGNDDKYDIAVERYVIRSKTLNGSFIPNMQLTPEVRDCNILSESQDKGASTGDQKMNELSENLGMNTGLHGRDNPTLVDLQQCIDYLKKYPNGNLLIQGRQFANDRRSPTINCQQWIDTIARFPANVLPNFEGLIPRLPNLN